MRVFFRVAFHNWNTKVAVLEFSLILNRQNKIKVATQTKSQYQTRAIFQIVINTPRSLHNNLTIVK